MISVIVPVYNVEKYLNRCVKSILSQTYRDYEVLLIDDGSTDKSNELCNLWIQRDNRIKVYYQQNQGLSAARNTGIKYAKGEWITFLDSDDYIEKHYLEILVHNMQMTSADISCCDYLRTDKWQIKGIDYVSNQYIELKGNDILVFYLENDIVSAWAKLYKRELFSNIKFPVGKINEDISTIFQIFCKAKKVTYSYSRLYFYYKNNEGITKQKFEYKNINLIEAWEEVVNFSKFYPINIQKLANFRLQKAYFTLLGIIAYYGMKNDTETEYLEKDILKKFKKYYKNLLISPYIGINKKIAIVLMRISFYICCKIGAVIRYLKKL